MKHLEKLREELDHYKKEYQIAEEDIARETPRLMAKIQIYKRRCIHWKDKVGQKTDEINKYLAEGLTYD